MRLINYGRGISIFNMGSRKSGGHNHWIGMLLFSQLFYLRIDLCKPCIGYQVDEIYLDGIYDSRHEGIFVGIVCVSWGSK